MIIKIKTALITLEVDSEISTSNTAFIEAVKTTINEAIKLHNEVKK